MKIKFNSLLSLFFYALSASVIDAQVGNVGINTTTTQAMLHAKDSSVLFSGAATLPVTPGNPPLSGAGTRLMWYPDKAAFRVGRVTGLNWDKDSIGYYSFAAGYNVIAEGLLSTAIGSSTSATENVSTALGIFTKSRAYGSVVCSRLIGGNYS